MCKASACCRNWNKAGRIVYARTWDWSFATRCTTDGITNDLVRRLQSMQKARMVTCTRRCDRISPVLHQMLWLLVRQRVEFEFATLVRQTLSGHAPSYLLMTRYRRPPQKTPFGWHQYASRQSDADQLRRQSLLCSWTLSLEQSADGPQSTDLWYRSEVRQNIVPDSVKMTVRWRRFYSGSGIPLQSVNLFNCSFEMLLLTYVDSGVWWRDWTACGGTCLAMELVSASCAEKSSACLVLRRPSVKNAPRCALAVAVYTSDMLHYSLPADVLLRNRLQIKIFLLNNIRSTDSLSGTSEALCKCAV